MKDTFIHQILTILKRSDIQAEIMDIAEPLINYIFSLLNPYLYLVLFLTILIFILLIAILILLVIVLQDKLPKINFFQN